MEEENYNALQWINKLVNSGLWAHLTYKTKSIIIPLFMHYNPIKGAFPSYETLMRESGIKQRGSIRNALDELEILGVLKVSKEAVKKGWRNRYDLCSIDKIDLHPFIMDEKKEHIRSSVLKRERREKRGMKYIKEGRLLKPQFPGSVVEQKGSFGQARL